MSQDTAQLAIVFGTLVIEALLYGYGQFREYLRTPSRPARLNLGSA